MENIIDKIRNLRAKADSAASTEAEVQSALDHAAKLMKKHGLTESQIKESSKAGMRPVVWSTGTKILPEVRYSAPAIAAFTESKVWIDVDEDGRERLKYIGVEQDVEMALYLTDLVHNSIIAAWKIYADTPQCQRASSRVRNKMRRDFSRAMAGRIRARLMDMVARRVTEPKASTGTDLVVLKRDLVNRAQAALGLNLRTPKARARKVYTDAHDAGVQAGNKTNLTTGIAA